MEEKTKGAFGLSVLLLSYVYYVVWILVTVMCVTQPWIDNSHYIQHYFPDRYWALVPPILFGVFILSIVCAVVGLALVQPSTRLN
jgi:hypothetical protein